MTEVASTLSVLHQSAFDAFTLAGFELYLLDEKGFILDINDSVTKATGYTRSELLSLSICGINRAPSCHSFATMMEQLQSKGGQLRVESAHYRADGSFYPVEMFFQEVELASESTRFVAIVQDISERKQAQSTIEKEHKRANHYLDIAGVIMVTLDLNGNIQLLNRFACQLLKIEQEQAIGLNWFDNFLTKEGKGIAQRAFNRLMQSTYIPNQKVEKPVVTRTGEERLILWYNRVLEDEDGNRIGILSSGTDITEQRLSEETLIEEKRRLRTLIDAIPDLIVFKNHRSEFWGCNEAFQSFTQIPEKQLVGKSDKDVFPPSIAYNHYQRDQAALRSGASQRLDEWVTYPDGRKVLLDTFVTPLFDKGNDAVGVLSISRDITEHQLLSGQLSLVNAMVDHSLDPLVCALPDDDFKIVYANSAALTYFGTTSEALYQTHLYDWAPDFQLEKLRSSWQRSSKSGTESRIHLLSHGELIPVEVSTRSFEYQDTVYFIAAFKDIRDRISYEQAVKTAEQRSRLLLENTNEGIFGLDTEGVTTFINPAAANMLNYEVDELIGRKNHQLIHHSHADGQVMTESECHMLKPIQDGKSYRVESDVLWRKDGSSFPVEYWSSPIYENDSIVGTVVTFHDISERKKSEEKIRYLAFHDALTGLPNRRLFLDRFEQELKREKRSGQLTALLMMDLDHFKEINDTLGHPAGDQLLVEVSDRVKSVLREGDTFARLGGDEFAILQSNIVDLSAVAALAEKVIRCFNTPFCFGDNKLKTNTSIGIIVCDAEVSVDESISRGDVALYRAKEKGRGCYVFYQSEMTDRVQRDAELAHMLSSARFLQQLYLHYQPQFDCCSGELVGVEALLRWKHPAQGAISPLTFIPVAEKRGMIDDIGLWVAQHVVMQASQWIVEGVAFKTISFNLSPVQLRNEEGIKQLLAVLGNSGTPLEHFEIEVTESACMDASASTLELLESYVQQGLRIAIDDFGTGYSSLTSLRKLSACRLKIDRSFINEMLTSENDGLIVTATIALAHSLGLEVVAEGVETGEQLECLRKQGCDIAQGFYLGFPMPAEELSKLAQDSQ